MLDSSQHKKLTRWLESHVFSTGEKSCKLIVARQLSASKVSGSEIYRFTIPPQPTQDFIREAIIEIETALSGDAESLGGVQRYALLPYYDEKEVRGRLVLAFRGENDEFNETFESEPANVAGLLSQTMRHLEAVMRIGTTQTAAVIQGMSRTIAQQGQTLEQMQAKHFETLALTEGLMNEQHARDLASKEADYKFETRKELTGQLKMLLPSAVNKIAGKQILKEETTPREEMVKALMSSLTGPQVEGLRQVLTPAQQVTLFALYSGMEDEDGEVIGDDETVSPPNGTGH